MKDLKKLANECMAELDEIGIQYGNVISWEVNTRAKKPLGTVPLHWRRPLFYQYHKQIA